MLEQITVGQVAITLTTIIGLITGVSFLHNKLKKWVNGALRTEFDTMNAKLDALGEKINVVDMETCKNFLVDHIRYIENGSALSEVEKERFYEQYAHYQKMGGNHYIAKKVEKLEKEGLL